MGLLYGRNSRPKSHLINLVWLMILAGSLSGCFFFRKKDTGKGLSESDQPVLGNPLGSKAGGPDYEGLEDLYNLTTSEPPAAIRPDPDTFVRQLLLQYREEGSVVAREIGRVEAYRPLLGGANEDFSKEPQDRYDATSLLASIKVAEELCRGLVAPNNTDHPGWESILPEKPSAVDENILFLAQRFTGERKNDISDEKLEALHEIFDLAKGSASPSNDSYIPVCTTLAVDAEGLLL